jgi:hypothetical protein
LITGAGVGTAKLKLVLLVWTEGVLGKSLTTFLEPTAGVVCLLGGSDVLTANFLGSVNL